MARYSRCFLLIALCALLTVGASSCSRSSCPAYDGLSSNEYNKQKKVKKKKSSGLYGKKGM